MLNNDKVKAIDWTGSSLILLDQRKIPYSAEYIECKNLDSVIDSIKKMIVRGAPAIAISGIYGICLYLLSENKKPNEFEFSSQLTRLLQSRPTAVNLRLSIDRYKREVFNENYEKYSFHELIQNSINFANMFYNEDLSININISKTGADIFENINKNLSILTHCNTGSLATAGVGTAIGVIKALRNRGFQLTVYASETRPYHQGSRLTSWEMMQEDIKSFIICDSMSAWVMKEKKIDAVIVGADRIASNGDTANKIGTFSHAIIAKSFNIPFYVAASATSFDFSIKDGEGIHIEMREEDELTQNSFLKDINGKNYIPEGVLAPMGARALNPAFDITPAEYITGIITEKGLISPVNYDNIKKFIN